MKVLCIENGISIIPETDIDKKFCRSLWQDAFKEGYKLGKNSRIGLNKSGCVCVFDKWDNIIEPCMAHKAWKEKK